MDSKIDELNRVAAEIVQQVDAAVDRWRSLPEQSITFRPSEDAWSVKEIIGHLIDSASNNHQRFVRLQLADRLDFPDYGDENVNWVKIQNYQAQKWAKAAEAYAGRKSLRTCRPITEGDDKHHRELLLSLAALLE